MTHDPAHDHGHAGHSHAPPDFGRAFAIGITLNLAFVVIEAAYGFAANSMALVADAGHNLSDVLGLAAAWLAATLAKRPPSQRYTYGLKSSSILAALFNAVFLLVAVGAIAREAVVRLFEPEPVAEMTVIVVAAIGILINGFTAWLFASGRRADINIRGAYLHMAADAAVSAGVVTAGIVTLITGWLWLDPVVSLVIVAVIIWSTWSLLRDSVAMSLNAVPANIDADEVRAFLAGLHGVTGVHDLHIWPMSTTEIALTVHVVRPQALSDDDFLAETARELEHRYGIHHTTIQIERGAMECHLAPTHIV
ncbi:MAG TPA: cation diffusion facilitator family transporter [Xanthobacteraceae bacterium]|nr:cation diffusion facilitator family transporter [Xanthobacteraceae bacterium]